MAYVKYECEFYSLNPDTTPESRFKLRIHKKSGTDPGTPYEFKCRNDGFTMTMDGRDDSMLSPIKTTSVEFTFIIEDGNTNQEQIIEDLQGISSENEGELCLEVQRWDNTSSSFRRYWIGVILGDLTYLDDRSPHNFIRIKAIDGLAQLKYKQFPISKEGTRSCLYYIKAALMEITSSQDDFGFWTSGDSNTENFLTHCPFYYNKAMGSINSSSWRDDLDNDPLALTRISSLAFKDNSGQYWSYYKILEQIVSAFQLRLMMTPLRDDSGSGDEFYSPNCTWLLQAPLIWHNSTDNPARDTGAKYHFYHGKTLSTDVALGYSGITLSAYNPSEILSGTKEVLIPPLLSYKCIYNHSNFLGVSLGPFHAQTAWSSTNGVGGDFDYSYSNGWAIAKTNNTSYSFFPLSKIQNQAPNGWVDNYTGKVSGQKILITGYVTVQPKFHAFQASSGSVGYDSAEEYFELYGGDVFPDAWGNNWYGVADNAIIMPRLGVHINTILKDPDGPILGSDGAYYRINDFFLGDRRFGLLAGSSVWSEVTVDTDLSVAKYEANEDWNFGDNIYGYNGTWYGIQHNPFNESTYSYIVDDVQQWGTDIGWSDMYWWQTTSPETNPLTGVFQNITHNRFAFVSPCYHDAQLVALNGSVSSSVWDDGVWSSVVSDYITSYPFTIESPPIPVSRPLLDENYGTNHIYNIEVYSLLGIDDCTTGSGSQQRAACKSWDYSSLYVSGSTSGGFESAARGIQWDYEINDVRVNITGVTAGENSFDSSIGWFENQNGTPSEEMTQEPEIIIGDNPPVDPFAFASDESTGTTGFGGSYPGEFRIHTKADDYDMAEDDSDIMIWRPRWQLGSGGGLLHHQRAENALAHYHQIKRGLQITFQDRTSTKEIEQKLASGIYYWASSHRWGKNQENDSVAYLMTGFKFTAGTGIIDVTFEENTSFNRSNLTDKSFSTNG